MNLRLTLVSLMAKCSEVETPCTCPPAPSAQTTADYLSRGSKRNEVKNLNRFHVVLKGIFVAKRNDFCPERDRER